MTKLLKESIMLKVAFMSCQEDASYNIYLKVMKEKSYAT